VSVGERRVGADQLGRFKPVEDGHADVHQDDVREHPPRDIDGFAAVAGLAGDLHVLLAGDQCGEACADGGLVVGDEAAIYLACEDYPAPCSESGARFRLEPGGRFQVGPPTSGEYAGLSVFADRGNTTSMQLLGDVDLAGAVYGASTQLRVGTLADVQIGSLVVVDRLRAASAAPVRVDYDPSLPLIGIEPPVLIR
jgi:hypothetical protein